MLAVRFDVPGDQAAQFERIFTRFTEGVTDLSEPFAEIGHDFQQRIIPDTFNSEGKRTGKAYAKLSKKYDRRKEKRWGPRPILVASGKMYDALAGFGPQALFQVARLRARFGVRLSGGGDSKRPSTYQLVSWHQGGTRRMPARPPVALTDRDKRAWSRIIAAYLEKQARVDSP